ncbi:uncharacterized protein K02A2.6-like [Pyrus x bretschneideri]|uniref:uncharacterized protein K02A2.6-like n=1 Tax=Pyrus x bretschneideri TaxID=225117 RepID=UPI00202E1044|nr:uncharacterized protein K02A2.6-like [Pyrus x bretschneideri]
MSLPSLLERGDPVDVCAVETLPDDWRRSIMRYLDNPSDKHDCRTMVHASNYWLYQNELYRKAKHAWILVANDYFTKWVEAKSYAELTSKEVCNFIEENIVTRFGAPETIITDNGTIFTSDRFKGYTMSFKIRLEQSTPYYAQANGQAKVSNKVLVGILEKMKEEKPSMWHLKSNKALWAYRTSPRSATMATSYALTYGHDTVKDC